MSATNIKVSNIFTAIFSPVLVILSVILSFLVAGNPANFQPYVKENVTTETAKIVLAPLHVPVYYVLRYFRNKARLEFNYCKDGGVFFVLPGVIETVVHIHLVP